MRWGILLCLCLLGCDDEFPEALYADGSDWEPVVPVRGPSSIPKDLREWDRFFGQSGIQADQAVKAFSPTWAGFSDDPTTAISYQDFGAIIYLWGGAGVTGLGISDDTAMTWPAGTLPTAARPSDTVVRETTVVDGGLSVAGLAVLEADGSVVFYKGVVTGTALTYDAAGFTALGAKGLPSGWMISYVK